MASPDATLKTGPSGRGILADRIQGHHCLGAQIELDPVARGIGDRDEPGSVRGPGDIPPAQPRDLGASQQRIAHRAHQGQGDRIAIAGHTDDRFEGLRS